MSRDPQTPSGGSRQPEPPRNLDEALAALQAEREKRERAERELVQLRDDEDSAGAECSRLECDQLDIHDALEDAGLLGAINAQSIVERVERGVADRDAALDRAERAERRLDEAVKALREGEKWVALTQDELRALEARHEPYGAEPRRSDVRWCLSRSIDTLRCALDGVQDFQGIRKALASIEAQPERGAEGEAPSTERS